MWPFLIWSIFLCRLRSIAAQGDHFVRRLFLSGSHTFLVNRHSYCFAGDTCIPQNDCKEHSLKRISLSSSCISVQQNSLSSPTLLWNNRQGHWKVRHSGKQENCRHWASSSWWIVPMTTETRVVREVWWITPSCTSRMPGARSRKRTILTKARWGHQYTDYDVCASVLSLYL